jgi:2EXR family
MLFDKLPIGIRHMILKYALPGPRIVFLEQDFPELGKPYPSRVWSNRAIYAHGDNVDPEDDKNVETTKYTSTS